MDDQRRFILQQRASAHALFTTHPQLAGRNSWTDVSNHETRSEAEEAAGAWERRNSYPSGCGVETRVVTLAAGRCLDCDEDVEVYVTASGARVRTSHRCRCGGTIEALHTPTGVVALGDQAGA